MDKVCVGVFKCGNIGTAPILELLLDELADRKDIIVRTVTTGSKMDVEAIENSIGKILEFNSDILLLISPNTSAPGPAKAREILSKKELPTIILTDGPGRRVKAEIDEQGLGYMIIMGDPLIGARKEFLDPIEMAIFNANVIKVLACTGVFRLIFQEIDKLIYALKAESKLSLPKLVIDTDYIRKSQNFRNPYAMAKAMAAYELLKKAAEINAKACFVEKDKGKYIPLVACAHEIAQTSAELADAAREIEKSSDKLLRTPHAKDGRLKIKEKLLSSPETPGK
ncbi:MAG: F420-dependent methylenetetrahydromethanopterin dehydrogenase [Candidatus Bathyarchaeota archaeon]|nr:MAG: F420-dependent methylenetetrahydromethanopterin dehydrogenase [Candidatus Bathyarchaeota archaeon]